MTEDVFLQGLFDGLPAAPKDVAIGPGDDCAAVRLSDGQLLLLAVDQLVGDRHFYAAQTEPEIAGRKLLARNVSDIAAMGGQPCHCVVATAAAAEWDEAWLHRFLAGIIKYGQQWNVAVIGGDLARAPHDFVASLTITGLVAEDSVCRRSGVDDGDRLFATGAFGSSLATDYHLHFMPRHHEGKWLADKRFAKAMIDVSDGLLLDAERICRASQVGLQLDLEAIPKRTPATTERSALTDGEDYELLFAVAPERVDMLQREWPFPDLQLTCIGTFNATPGRITSGNGHVLNDIRPGFDHFCS